MSKSLADLKKERLDLLASLLNISRADLEYQLRAAGVDPGPQVIG